MSLTKDGFYKQIGGVIGDNSYVLLAGGGHQKFGNESNYIPISNGTLNTNLNADLLDGYHYSSFSFTSHTHKIKLGATEITIPSSGSVPTAVTSIIGPFAVNTQANPDKAFSIQRESSSEGVKHWVDDGQYHIDYTNDETSSSIHIRVINTDTESPHNPRQTTDFHYYLDCYGEFYPGSNNTGSIGTSGNKWANMYATTFHGALEGNATSATNVYVNQSQGNNYDYPLVWSNQNNTTSTLGNQLYKSYNNLVYNSYERSIRISNGYTYHPIIKDGAGRPGISISGNYPYIWLTGGGVSNGNHGATITLAAPDSVAGTNGAFKAWTFGVPGQNAKWLDVGYGTSTNPHGHGMANYNGSNYTGPNRLLRFNSDPYQLIIYGKGTDSNGSLIVYSSDNNSWTYAGSFLAPNIGSSHNVFVNIGKANSTRNSFGFNWCHVSDGNTSNYGAVEIWGVGTQQRWYADGNTMMYARFQVRNTSNTDYNYSGSAMWIREYNYGGSQADSWGNAPRLGWHWSGRVAAQIGLASNGWLYEAPNTGTSFYRIVLERSDMKWGINVDLLDGYHAGNSSGQIPISNGTINTNLNTDMVDGHHQDHLLPYRYTYGAQTNSGSTDWYVRIRTNDWITNDAIIYVRGDGSNTSSDFVIHLLCRENRFWGWQTSYNGVRIIGIAKETGSGEILYLKMPSSTTSISFKSTFPLTIDKADYSSKSYMSLGEGLFANYIYGRIQNSDYTDSLTNPGKYYWANLPMQTSANSSTSPTFNVTTHNGEIQANAGIKWAPNTNIRLPQSGNGQEWSFDITRNGYTGGYWHVWDSAYGSLLTVYPDNGNVLANRYLGVGGNNLSYTFYVNGNSLLTGITYFGSTSYWINNGGVEYMYDIRASRIRLVDNWIGFYTSNNVGGNRLGYIQTDGSYMYFRKENGNAGFNFNGNLVPSSNLAANIGTNTLSWNRTFSRYIDTRHLDASAEFTTDMNLYIGYGAVTPTQNIYFYYSTGTRNSGASSRTHYATINSNGMYAHPRFGVNGQNTSYNFYVNGNSLLTGYINFNDHGYLMSGRSTSFNYGYSLSLGDSSQSMGMFSGPGGEEGAVIVSPDTCVIYNSFDQGWGFQVFDKDRGGDLTTDNSRVFGVNQANYFVWSRGGFWKEGSSDTYVLLGGGGHQDKRRWTFTYNSANYNDSSGLTVNQMAADGNSNSHVGMIYSGTDNPVSSGGNWIHVWSQTWNLGVTSSWVSQIALGVQQGTGMWYRTTSGNIVGRGWIRVLDSSNYTTYVNNYYWANVKVSTSSSTDTSPTFYHAYLKYYLYMQDSGGNYRAAIDRSGNSPIFGYGFGQAGYHVYYTGYSVSINAGTSWSSTGNGIYINSSNNIGIGCNDPSYKLDISGGVRVRSGNQILIGTTSKGSSDVYNGGIQLREATYSTTSCTDNMYDAPGITFHWGGWWVHKLNMHSNDIFWDNNRIWHSGNDGSGSGLDADLLDGYHANNFVYNTCSTFVSQYNNGLWMRFLTITNVRNLGGTITFMWHPEECTRGMFSIFNINFRSNDIIFYETRFGSESRTLKVTGDGTTFYVWVKASSKASWDPYGAIQHLHSRGLTYSYYSATGFTDTEPSGTYGKIATCVNYANSADYANGAGYLRDRSNGTATYANYGAAGLGWGSISWLTCWNGYELRAISKSEMGNTTIVNQNTSSNSYYPLVWSNRQTTTNDQGNQLYKSYDYLLYNPSTKVLRNDGPLWLRPDRDATLKIYSGKITDGYSDGFICMQTSIDGTDGQSHSYPTNYGARCVIALQPRGGEVYIGKTITAASTSADANYKLNVGGNAWYDGNLYLNTGDTDKFIQFSYNTNNYAGASWRLISRGSGSGDTNYFDIETGGSNSSATTWYRVIRLTMDNRYVGIGTDSPYYKLHVVGDSYATGWSKAGSGFYCEGNGVHYTHLGSYGEIYLSSNNVFNFTTGSWSTLYFNYGGSGKYGNTWVSNYVWHAGSTSTYADHNIGKLHVRPTSGNYSWNEGIRLHAASNGWTTLTLCGTDNTGDTGTSANTWSLHAYGSNFYLTKNGSDTGTSYMRNVSNKWYFNTTSGGEAVNIGGWVGTVGANGWYNITYGGGMWMNDSTYVRVYNGKYLYGTYFYTDIGEDASNISRVYCSQDRYIRAMNIGTFKGLFDDRFYRQYNTTNLNPNYGNGDLYHGYGTGMSTQSGITGNWYHIWSSGWSDNSNWISQIAIPTADGWASNSAYYRTIQGSNYAWRKFMDDRNYRAQYGTTGGTSYIQIKINSATSWMLSFVVRVYQSYGQFDLVFSGYNYGDNHWYSPQVRMASGTVGSVTCYFGYDSSWNLWVGFPGASYTGVEIIECANGYTQTGKTPGDLFTISNVSSFSGTIQVTTTAYQPVYRNEAYWANLQVQTYASDTQVPSFGAIRMNGVASAGTNYITGSAGRIYFGGNFHIDSLGSNKTYINHYSANDVYMVTGGGKVGIGTTGPSYKLHVAGDSYTTGWSRAASGFYVHDQGVHYTYQQSGMPLIYLTSNEFNFGQSGATLYFNYRSSRLGTTTTNYVWNAGSSSSWANHNMGNIWLNGSGVYVRIGPQNSSHAHYETNAGTSHWFNKRIDVNGDIYLYGTSVRMQKSNGYVYSSGFYHNSYGSSNYFLTSDGSARYWPDLYDNRYYRQYYTSNPDPITGLWNGYGVCMTTQGSVPGGGSWWHIFSAGWSGTNDWISQLALPTENLDRGVWFRMRHSSSTSSWRRLHDYSHTYTTNGKGVIGDNYVTTLPISGYSTDGLSFYQTSASFDGSSADWAHYIIANHGDGASYYHYTIRLPFWGIPQYRRQTGSTSSVTQWYNFITEENITNYWWANVNISNTSSTSTWPSFGSAYSYDWWRSYNATGWYNETYGGGIYMTDSTWIRTYGSKNFYVQSGSLYVGEYAGIGNGPDANYGRLVFPENNIAIGFRPNNASYKTSIQYMTYGNEALVFSACNSVTSFIFKCGHSASDGSNWQNSVIGTPSIQIKNQSLYVNAAIGNDVTPGYNFYVGGTSYFMDDSYFGGTVIINGGRGMKYGPLYMTGRCVDLTSYTSWIPSHLRISGSDSHVIFLPIPNSTLCGSIIYISRPTGGVCYTTVRNPSYTTTNVDTILNDLSTYANSTGYLINYDGNSTRWRYDSSSQDDSVFWMCTYDDRLYRYVWREYWCGA